MYRILLFTVIHSCVQLRYEMKRRHLIFNVHICTCKAAKIARHENKLILTLLVLLIYLRKHCLISLQD